MATSKLANEKEDEMTTRMWRLRNGYVWTDKDGRAAVGIKIVSESDPGFKSQQYKLEPVEVAERDAKASEDRMVRGAAQKR